MRIGKKMLLVIETLVLKQKKFKKFSTGGAIHPKQVACRSSFREIYFDIATYKQYD